MHLETLRVHRLPGLPRGASFEVGGLGSKTNVVLGPNASGKSSILRAVRATLTATEDVPAELDIELVFRDGEHRWTASRSGKAAAQWERDGERFPAPGSISHHAMRAATIGIEELMAFDTPVDAELTSALVREVAGGYDIASVRKELTSPTRGAAVRKQVQEANRAFTEAQRRSSELNRKRAMRAEWTAEIERLTSQRGRVQAVQDALALVHAENDLRRLADREATFPPFMDRLHQLDAERLQRIDEAIGQARQHAESAEALARAARRKAEDTGLASRSLTSFTLSEQRAEVARLRQLEADAKRKAEELQRAATQLEQAESELGGSVEVPIDLNRQLISEAERTLMALREAQAEVAAAQSEIDALTHDLDELALPAYSKASDIQAAIGQAQTLRSKLLDELRSSQGLASSSPASALLRFAVVTLGALVIGLGLFAGESLTAIAGALVAMVGVGLLLAGPRNRRPDAVNPHAYAELLGNLGIAVPTAASPEASGALLASLDRRISDLANAANLHNRRERMRAAQAKSEGARQEAEGSLRALASQARFGLEALGSNLTRWLDLLRERREAQARVDFARQEQSRAAEEGSRLRDQLLAFLADHGQMPSVVPPSVESIDLALKHVEQRFSELQAANREEESAKADDERAQSEIQRGEADLTAFFDGFGLPVDGHGEARRLFQAAFDRLSEWAALVEERKNRNLDIKRCRDALLGYQDLLALAEERRATELEDEQRRLSDLQERIDKLIDTVKEFDAGAKQAELDRTLETATANRDQAVDQFKEVFQAALFQRAATSLLDVAEQDFLVERQPRVVEVATTWFSTFTDGMFALKFNASRSNDIFYAQEVRSGESRQIGELSTATRMQLLLAIRVAYAMEQSEGALRAPIILDEALTTSDGERFAAVARNLGRLAETEGRQVIYLTAREEDAAAWEAAVETPSQRIELTRGFAARPVEARPGALRLPKQLPVPSPDGMDDVAYGEALGVPAVNLDSPPDSIHLFHVLRDQLGLLESLLTQRVSTIGEARAFLASGIAEHILAEPQRGDLQGRVEIASAWHQAQQIGRVSDPMLEEHLENAPQRITPSVRDQLIELWRTKATRQGSLFLELLKDPAERITRFKDEDRAELATHLEDLGYAVPRLSPHERWARLINQFQTVGVEHIQTLDAWLTVACAE